jgi:hypothetical protein
VGTRNPNTLLIEENTLSFSSLYSLFNAEVLALKIPNFYEGEKCRNLSEALSNIVKNESTSSGTIYQSDVDSFWNTIDNSDIKARYFGSAVQTMRRLRRISLPFATPIDLLRLELDEVWPTGASLLHIEGKTMLFGITRLWPSGTEALPHQDILLREIPEADEVKNELSQAGVNIYLRPAEVGGELEIWDYSFSNDDCLKLGIRGSYGFDREMLPPDSLVITPQEGDLILLNTTKVHAIRKTIQGERITISGFLGYWGLNKLLRFWS